MSKETKNATGAVERRTVKTQKKENKKTKKKETEIFTDTKWKLFIHARQE